jgi:NAD(P)-dependent dehydrogenase (short-subunit alcohol dehydrogenase family)
MTDRAAMPTTLPLFQNCCVFGATGGIGQAIAAHLAAQPGGTKLHLGARTAPIAQPAGTAFTFDLTDENSIAAAAAQLKDRAPFDLIFIATGMLQDDAIRPEKSLSMQTPAAYEKAFAINCTGPALIGKHFLPLLARDRRSVFAVLSARVGSISDNHLGGWHAYRASKAALNMVVRNFAVELARTHPQAIAVALHPGTVDTPLSKPFQRNVDPGKLFTPAYSAERMLTVLAALTPADSGQLFAWDGQRVDF